MTLDWILDFPIKNRAGRCIENTRNSFNHIKSYNYFYKLSERNKLKLYNYFIDNIEMFTKSPFERGPYKLKICHGV